MSLPWMSLRLFHLQCSLPAETVGPTLGFDGVHFTTVFISRLNPNIVYCSQIIEFLLKSLVLREKSHFFISPFRPQDGNKPAETSQPQSSTGGYNQPSLGYGQSNYSYPQVPGSYPMQPVSAPPSYPPTRSVFSCLFLWPVSQWNNRADFFQARKLAFASSGELCYLTLPGISLTTYSTLKPQSKTLLNIYIFTTVFFCFFFLIYSDEKQWHESR